MTKQKCNQSSSQCKADVTNVRRLVGYFCSDTVYSFSRKVLTDTEIKVLEKDLKFAPLQNRINELKASLLILKNLHVEWEQNSIS